MSARRLSIEWCFISAHWAASTLLIATHLCPTIDVLTARLRRLLVNSFNTGHNGLKGTVPMDDIPRGALSTAPCRRFETGPARREWVEAAGI